MCSGINKRLFTAARHWIRDLDQAALVDGWLVIRWDFYLTAEEVEPTAVTPGVGFLIKTVFTHIAHHLLRPAQSTFVFLDVCAEYANIVEQDQVSVDTDTCFVTPHLQKGSLEPKVTSLAEWITSLDVWCAVEVTCAHFSTRATIMAVLAGHARIFMMQETRRRIWAGSLDERPQRRRGQKKAYELLDGKAAKARDPKPPHREVAGEAPDAHVDVPGDDGAVASDQDAKTESSSDSDVVVELVEAASTMATASQGHVKSAKTVAAKAPNAESQQRRQMLKDLLRPHRP